MGLFKGLFKAVVDTATLPVDMTRDVVKTVVDPFNDDESATLRRVKKIDRDLEETLEDD